MYSQWLVMTLQLPSSLLFCLPDPPSSLDCITNYNANADLSLLDHERNKLNQPNNPRTTPPVSGDDIIGNLLHIHNPQPNDPHPCCHRRPWKNWTHAMSKPFPPPIHPCKQFKPNTRPDANAKAMYERATTLSAPIGIFIEADQRWKQLKQNINNVNQNSTNSAI